MRHSATSANRPARVPALALLLALLLAITSPAFALSQDVVPETGTPVAPESAELAAPTPAQEDSAVANDGAETPASDPEEPTAAPESEPSEPGLDETAAPAETAEATPPTPHMTFTPSLEPVCLPAPAFAGGSIAAGASFDYDCTLSVEISAKQLIPGDIAIDWAVSASVEGTWSVQVMTPWIEEGAWSEPGLSLAELFVISQAPDALLLETASLLSGTVTLPFGLRLYRPACSTDLPLITVATGVAARVPANDAALVTQQAEQPLPIQLAPDLAPVPDVSPTVSIEQVVVTPVPFSLTEQTTTGLMTVRVDNPIVQCRPWSVQVSVETYAGSVPVGITSVIAVGAIDNATGGGYYPLAFDPALGVGQSAGASFVETGATPGSFTQTIEFTVTLPGQLSAGVLTVHATAIVEPAPAGQ